MKLGWPLCFDDNFKVVAHRLAGVHEKMKIEKASNLRRGLKPHGWVYQNVLNPIRDRLTFAIRLRSTTEPGVTGLWNAFLHLAAGFNPRWTESAKIL